MKRHKQFAYFLHPPKFISQIYRPYSAQNVSANSAKHLNPREFPSPSPYSSMGNIRKIFYLSIGQSYTQQITNLLLLFGYVLNILV